MVAAGVVRPAEPRAQPEVGEFDVSAPVDEHVVRLDVAVNEAHSVHAVDRQHQLRDEEPRQALVEHAQPDQQTHQIAARNVLHHEVQVRRILRDTVLTRNNSAIADKPRDAFRGQSRSPYNDMLGMVSY